MSTLHLRAAAPLTLVVLTFGLTGCVANAPTPASPSSSGVATGGPTAVTITETGCDVAASSLPSGKVTFKITNNGSVPNEFEILANDKLRIISELENIGPGSSVELTTALDEGSYFTACKPNMVGQLVGTKELTITKGADVAVDSDTKALEADAVKNYTAYVRDQVGSQLSATKEFAEAYTSGDTAKAKALFPQARKYYERIEPTAEAFGLKEAGDLDTAIDLRIQDLAADAKKPVTDPTVLAQWHGWHRIEADLFSSNAAFKFKDAAARKTEADLLVANTQKLYDLVYGKIDGASGKFELTLKDVEQGAKDLLNEVATSKIVGEEDTFSHTDLADFAANVEGAKVAYGNVQKLVAKKDAALDKTITEQFTDVSGEIDKYKQGTSPDGGPAFVDYSTIAAVQKDAGEAPSDGSYTVQQKAISQKVNALSESLSKVAGTILR